MKHEKQNNSLLVITDQVAQHINSTLGKNVVTAERNASPTTWTRGDCMKHRDASVVIKSYANNHREDIAHYSRKLEKDTAMDQKDITWYKKELEDAKKRFNSAKKYEKAALEVINTIGTPVETKGWAGSDEFKPARIINGYIFDTSSFPISVWSKNKFKGLHSLKI